MIALTVDESSLAILHDGRTVQLRRREWQIFHTLWKRRGRATTREVLKALLQRTGAEDVTDNLLTAHVFNLRTRLRRLPIEIETVPSVGYKLQLKEVDG